MFIDGRASVLVVDPDPAVGEVVRNVLREHFVVDVARTLQEAAARLERRPYAAIVCDYEARFGDEACGFKDLVRHCWPRVRHLALSDHVAPHLATLLACRRSRWSVDPAGVRSGMLLDALVASADDPAVYNEVAN